MNKTTLLFGTFVVIAGFMTSLTYSMGSYGFGLASVISIALAGIIGEKFLTKLVIMMIIVTGGIGIFHLRWSAMMTCVSLMCDSAVYWLAGGGEKKRTKWSK